MLLQRIWKRVSKYFHEKGKIDMMLHPSYSDLMEIANKEVEEGENKLVNSRYSIVLATARRARQIISGSNPYVPVKENTKPLSIAVDELYRERVKIVGGEEKED